MADTRNLLTMDPYELNNFLIDLAETYFKTDKLDTYEAGFLGYMIRALSHLTSDVLFMNSMSYNEAFTTKAILDTSLVNLANMFAYDYRRPIPASGSLNLRIPLSEYGFSFIIPQYAKATASGIPFRVMKKYVVNVNSESDIRVYSIDKTNALNAISISIDNSSSVPILTFDVDIEQVDYYTYTFTFPRTYLYKFYREYIKNIQDMVSDVRVIVNGERYRQVNTIFEAGSEDKVFQYDFSGGTLEVIFGNGVFGKLPDDGDECKIIIESTKGSDGNVIANSVQLIERIYSDQNKAVTIYSTNNYPITNGMNGETTDEMRSNIIAHISSLDRLVNETDYKRFQNIIPEFRNIIAKNYLLRRDVHQNEISTFVVFFDENNDPIPTTSYSFETSATTFNKNTIFTINGEDYICPFSISIGSTDKIKHVEYEYVASLLKDSPYMDKLIRGELIGLQRIEFEYDDNSGGVVVVAYANSDSSTVDYLDVSGEIIIGSNTYNMPIVATESSSENILLKSTTIDPNDIPIGFIEYTFNLKWQNNIHSVYKNHITLRQDLKDVVWSTFIDNSGTYKLYNVPVVLKSFYDEHKEYFDSYVLQQIVKYKQNYTDYNMMTDVMNIKFANTYGKSINMRLNSYNSEAKYTYSSSYYLDIPFKLSINAIVHANHSKTLQDIRQEIKDITYTYLLTNADFHMDIFRSNLIRYIHDVVDDVAGVEINVPTEDVVYSFDIEKIPTSERDKLLSFVPEFIWIKKDDIYVSVEVLSM